MIASEVAAQVGQVMVGEPVDDEQPAIIVTSVRLLEGGPTSEWPASSASRGTAPDTAARTGLVLQVEFELSGTPGVWRFTLPSDELDQDELAYFEPDQCRVVRASLPEFVAGEVSWQLREWERTRLQGAEPGSPRLLE